MDNKELIEKLKKPELAQPLWMLEKYHPESALILRTARCKNCLRIPHPGIDSDTEVTVFGSHGLYYLKPEYVPEPEHVDIEVEQSSYKSLCVKGPPLDGRTSIHKLPCRPDFVGFFTKFINYQNRMALPDIATRIREGHKVYARFVKE